jgi:hypothetical protein
MIATSWARRHDFGIFTQQKEQTCGPILLFCVGKGSQLTNCYSLLNPNNETKAFCIAILHVKSAINRR